LCSIKSWAQTLQDGYTKTVAINLEIAASAASHGTTTKVRGVISYVHYYALLDGYLGTNSLRLAEQSTIEVGQTIVEGHVSLTLLGVEHVAVASDSVNCWPSLVRAWLVQLPAKLSWSWPITTPITTRRKEITVVNCILNVLGAVLVVVFETLMVEGFCSIQA
jgi:hypothetical protein